MDALPEFDIVFETITLLHILDEKEYRKSLEIMKSAAPYIFICEHMADSAPVSPYSKLRTFEQYEQDFKPFKLVPILSATTLDLRNLMAFACN